MCLFGIHSVYCNIDFLKTTHVILLTRNHFMDENDFAHSPLASTTDDNFFVLIITYF